MSLSNNAMKQVVVRFYAEANRANLAIFDEVFAQDFASYGGAGDMRVGRE